MKHPSTSEHPSKTTIRGMVLPAQWNDRFEVTGVIVACHDEREFRVENLENFPELRSLAQKEVIFTGLIQKKDGVETIFLESFSPIEKGGK